MKQSWIGVGLLFFLLACGIFSTWQMDRRHTPMAEDMKQAASMAEAGQWAISESYVNRAKQKWEDNWGFAASMADHEPMEQINALFSQLELCGRHKETLSYCMLCAQLEEALSAMGEAHRFVWWNLL